MISGYVVVADGDVLASGRADTEAAAGEHIILDHGIRCPHQCYHSLRSAGVSLVEMIALDQNIAAVIHLHGIGRRAVRAGDGVVEKLDAVDLLDPEAVAFDARYLAVFDRDVLAAPEGDGACVFRQSRLGDLDVADRPVRNTAAIDARTTVFDIFRFSMTMLEA